MGLMESRDRDSTLGLHIQHYIDFLIAVSVITFQNRYVNLPVTLRDI